jgi:hypothetical protein
MSIDELNLDYPNVAGDQFIHSSNPMKVGEWGGKGC